MYTNVQISSFLSLCSLQPRASSSSACGIVMSLNNTPFIIHYTLLSLTHLRDLWGILFFFLKPRTIHSHLEIWRLSLLISKPQRHFHRVVTDACALPVLERRLAKDAYIIKSKQENCCIDLRKHDYIEYELIRSLDVEFHSKTKETTAIRCIRKWEPKRATCNQDV